MRPAAVILDFDGVIADSEASANRALSQCLTEIGMATTFEECLGDYCGHNWRETERRIALRFGRPPPADFRERLAERKRALSAEGLAPVRGVAAFLEALGPISRAIASSSSSEYIGEALDRFGLRHYFAANIYSADGWHRGKPHPDIYLAAAQGLGVDPRACLAIEDSPTGAQAALAAGMEVVGFCGASHIVDRATHGATLRDLGVHRLACKFGEICLELGSRGA